MRLRRRLALARRGHKLLKDKEEQLLSYFYKLLEKIRGAREELESELLKAAGAFQSARSGHGPGELHRFFSPPAFRPEINCEMVSILNIRLPHFECRWPGGGKPGAFSELPLDLAAVVLRYRDLLEPLLNLAELETNLLLFAREVETTRRRVNSLEYILIPELEKTTRAIEMRLGEVERENFVRLRHIKQQ